MEILNNIELFKPLTFNYGKTKLSNENLKTLQSSVNSSGPRYVKIRSYIEKCLFLLASVILWKRVFVQSKLSYIK